MSTICNACEKKAHFTFNWTIENGYGLAISGYLLSPKFIVQSMENTKWRLRLKVGPQVRTIVVSIQRKDNAPESIEIEYELSFLAADGSPFTMETFKEKFSGMYESENEVMKAFDQFFIQRANLLPNDTLHVRCRMWRTGTEVFKSDTCFARTRLRVDRRSFVWTIREFSKLELEQRVSHSLNQTSNCFPQVILNVFLSERKGKKYLVIETDKSSEKRGGFVFCKFSLLDSDGRVIKITNKSSHFRILMCYYLEFNKKLFEIDKLLEKETSLLKDDVLNLNCEILLNVDTVSNQIEHYRCSNLKDIESMISDMPEEHLDQTYESLMDSCPFKKTFEDLHLNESFSDVVLEADEQTFYAHKIVLSTSSPVFKAMMTKEIEKKSVNISDMDADTLGHMLLYIYKDTVQDLQWEKAMNLYRAAETYQLLDLRKKCSFILKSSLLVGNVCNILTFANMQNDGNLRRAAEKFISKHDIEVLKSGEWKKFKEENFQFAFEVMERVINERINYDIV